MSKYDRSVVSRECELVYIVIRELAVEWSAAVVVCEGNAESFLGSLVPFIVIRDQNKGIK